MTVELAVEEEPLPEAVATAAYFMVAECLANADRHAGAETAPCAWRRADGQRGDRGGRRRLRRRGRAAGTGLRGLADRMAVLGGRLAVESPAGEGTRVLAAIPLEPAA